MQDSKVACESARKDLLNCLLQSECYKIIHNMYIMILTQNCTVEENMTPRECLERGQNMPEECKPIRIRLYQCKRSQIDARTRFRGKRE